MYFRKEKRVFKHCRRSVMFAMILILLLISTFYKKVQGEVYVTTV